MDPEGAANPSPVQGQLGVYNSCSHGPPAEALPSRLLHVLLIIETPPVLRGEWT